MRKLIVTLIAGTVGALGLASDSHAVPTFTVLQSGTGSATVTVAPGGSQTLTFDVIFSYAALDSVAGYSVSLEWDGAAAPGTDPLLDGVSGTSTAAAGFVIPIALGAPVQSAGGVEGTLGSYAASALPGPVAGPATFTIGNITVHVVAGAVAGDTTSITPFLAAPDGVGGPGGVPIACNPGVPGPGGCTYNAATINVIPEPATASLLGLGLIGLAAAGRRARRS